MPIGRVASFGPMPVGLSVARAASAGSHTAERQKAASALVSVLRALLKTLGASNLRIVQGLTAEFLALGLVAELLGAASATLVAYILAVAVFDFDYRFNPWLVPIGLVVGGISVALVGVLATRSSLRDPPIATLRKS